MVTLASMYCFQCKRWLGNTFHAQLPINCANLTHQCLFSTYHEQSTWLRRLIDVLGLSLPIFIIINNVSSVTPDRSYVRFRRLDYAWVRQVSLIKVSLN